MPGFNAFLTFLIVNSNLFFLVAIGAVIADMTMAKKSRRAAHIVATISLCACTPLFVMYAIVSVLRPYILTWVLTALWGWGAQSAWKTWRMTRPWKPAVIRNRPSNDNDRRN